jgi:hypothetical protein
MWLTVAVSMASPTIRSNTARPVLAAGPVRHGWCDAPTLNMTTRLVRQAALAAVAAALCVGMPAEAQYFGRNKVQYEKFDWRILKTDHFDLFFYPAESLKVHDAGRQSERWYTRLSDIFRHQFDRKSIVWYADHPDFQQTNVIGDQLSEGTGGVTEGMRTRVIMPFTGVYKDDEHVTGHELVHVFQYNIAETAPGQGGLARLGALPLWLVEGMAEYFSLGRNDALTAMWMRDAVMRDRFPTIKQLTTDPRFFPYRYGQALWAYIGGRWGDRAVVDVYRTSLRLGWDQALIRALGISSDSLAKDWAAANKSFYAGQIAGRTHPDSAGTRIVRLKERSEYNLGPALSADGRYLAFFTTKNNLFGIDLVVADANNGKILHRLAGPQSDGHFDAISFLNSSGDFSPAGDRFAFIVYNDGNNEITVVDSRNGDIRKRLRPGNVGAIYNLAWSPDGRSLAFSGAKGGVSDLYIVNLETNEVRQLTNDRYADLQPAFSPDGRTIAFATDRSAQTDFEKLTFGTLQLATVDVATGEVTVRQGFAEGKHINPQFTADGRSVLFVSDQDGISDLYRMDLTSGQMFRLTRLATGVSGVTAISPAVTVARQTGRAMFTVFKNQGHEIVSLDPSQLTGEPVNLTAGTRLASAATLPPGDVGGSATVAAYLADPMTGLVSGSEFRTVPYRPSFGLDAIGQPSVGVTAGGYFGGGVAGGISALWGDQLGDQQIFGAIDANGGFKDIGGAVYYTNLRRRLNWLGGLQHTPYLGAYQQTRANVSAGTVEQDLVIQRIFIDQATVSAQYPFSQTRRFELGVSGTRLGFEQQIDRITFLPNGVPIDRELFDTAGPPAVYYAQGTMAFVGDNSYSGFTSPIMGTRWRVEAAPTVGSVNFNTALVDYRRYFFFRPTTLAFRALHYGRYGRDADNAQQITPIYLGDEQLIRGYPYRFAYGTGECQGNDPSRCSVEERLYGSRIGVFNAEFRVPFLGTTGFGLINFPYVPVELTAFFDGGIAWTGSQPPEFRWDSDPVGAPAACLGDYSCAIRTPVFSTGISARINILGYLILESYLAKPFQRPNRSKDWVLGFNIAPGW